MDGCFDIDMMTKTFKTKSRTKTKTKMETMTAFDD